jgi:hypothetical protein
MNTKSDKVIFGSMLLETKASFAFYGGNEIVVRPGSTSVFYLVFNRDNSFKMWSTYAHPETYPGSRILEHKYVKGTDREEAVQMLHEYLTDPKWAYGPACALIGRE